MKLWIVLCAAFFLIACSAPEPTANNTTTQIPPLVGETEFSAMPTGSYQIRESTVEYLPGVSGFLAVPAQGENYPGVILIQEWWGLNENMKETARHVASHGYTVLAVDLYEGKLATNASDAQALRTSRDPQRLTEHLDAANELLRARGANKVATWGFCFGGGESMRYALSGDVDATVVYYGDLRAAILAPQDVEAPVLLIYGDQDKSTTADSARELQMKLAPYNVQAELYVYEGVGHAFANPSNAGHDKTKTRDAWEKTLGFLEKTLG